MPAIQEKADTGGQADDGQNAGARHGTDAGVAPFPDHGEPGHESRHGADQEEAPPICGNSGLCGEWDEEGILAWIEEAGGQCTADADQQAYPGSKGCPEEERNDQD